MVVASPLPADEDQRLRQLRDLAVLDTAAEPVFDEIARHAAAVCATPIALLSLVDSQRLWFKAHVGLAGLRETSREHAFCSHAILGDALFEVADAGHDPRFAAHPLVAGEAGIRFYAGAPLELPGGGRIGTLCVLDRVPRALDAQQRVSLSALARIAVSALQLRRELLDRATAVRATYESRLAEREANFRAIVEQQSELVSLSRPGGELVYVNPAYARFFGTGPQQIVGRNLFEFVPVADWPAVRLLIADVLATGQSGSGENRVLPADGSERWVAWTNQRQADAGGEVLLHSVGRDITERKQLEQRLVERERFMRLVADSVPVRIAYVDREQRFRFVNRAHCLRFGLPREAVIDRSRAELLVGIGEPAADPRVDAVLQGQRQRFDYEEVVDDRRLRIERQLIPDLDEQGLVRGYFSIGVDITERSAAEQTLRSLSATLGAVLEAIPAIVSVVGNDGRFRYVNHAFERWVGSERAAIVGRTLADVLGEAEFDRSQPWVEHVLTGETVSFDKAYPERGGGHLAISYVPLRLPDGAVDGFVSVAQDITHHKREEVRLLQLAQRDSLTGLLNRTGFEAFLQRCGQASGGTAMALLYIDLDRFKPVNDAHGHAVGDELLRQFAQRMQALVRPSDAVARLGGDEFAIALPGARDAVVANRVAEMIVHAAASPFEIDGLRLAIGASAGVALGVDVAGSWHELIARADEALYLAKSAGRGRWVGAPGPNPG